MSNSANDIFIQNMKKINGNMLINRKILSLIRRDRPSMKMAIEDNVPNLFIPNTIVTFEMCKLTRNCFLYSLHCTI